MPPINLISVPSADRSRRGYWILLAFVGSGLLAWTILVSICQSTVDETGWRRSFSSR